MRFRHSVMVTALVVLCSSGGVADPGGMMKIEPIVKGNSAFAVDLYGRLARLEKGNLFFSPASIHTALAMAYAGARGQTAQEMAQALHFGLDQKELHLAFASLLETLNNPRKGYGNQPTYQLCVANALWGQYGYPFAPGFVDLVKKSYGAGLNEVDFSKPEEARARINDWVTRQTREKIKELIPAQFIQAAMRLILTNAVYFKSNWAETFSKEATQEKPFRVSAGQLVNVAMMQQQAHFDYGETDQAQILVLPYIWHSLAMTILLPSKKDGLGAFEGTFTAQPLSRWGDRLKRVKVDVSFPRFKFASSFGLGEALQSLGVKTAFSPEKADFSGMTTAEKPFISAVIHKAFVAVDEEGTEAAAATAVGVAGAGMPIPEEPKVFNADHPFIFMIRHKGTGEVLFVGRVVDPTAP